MARRPDPNSTYWDAYSPLQHKKHELIRRYLGGWFPKLASWAGQVLYIDTHAGRGRHAGGEPGSPLVALETLLNHHYLDALLKKAKFIFHFIEVDAGNLEALRREIASLGELPVGISVVPHGGESFSVLRDTLTQLRESASSLAPAFVFVDPFGFKIPGAVLRDLMQAGRVEVFVNLMWRELDMALVNPSREGGLALVADEVFDGPEWRNRVVAASSDERAEQAIDLLAIKLGAKWSTPIRMPGDNGATRYILLHLTSHDEGRDLMKECVWSVCGGFYARKFDDPAQQLLITPEPDWSLVRSWVLEQLRVGPLRLIQLHERARPTIWRSTHVNKALKQLKKAGTVAFPGYVKDNPVCSIT